MADWFYTLLCETLLKYAEPIVQETKGHEIYPDVEIYYDNLPYKFTNLEDLK